MWLSQGLTEARPTAQSRVVSRTAQDMLTYSAAEPAQQERFGDCQHPLRMTAVNYAGSPTSLLAPDKALFNASRRVESGQPSGKLPALHGAKLSGAVLTNFVDGVSLPTTAKLLQAS